MRVNCCQELDGLLGELAAKGVPPLTSGFQHNVWREIRRRRVSVSGWSLGEAVEWLLGAAWRPRPVLAALALALTVGVLLGTGTAVKPRVSLDAFSSHAPGLWLNSIK